MKHRSFRIMLFLFAFLHSLSMNGKVVTQQKALEFATRFFANHIPSRSNTQNMTCIWNSNQLLLNARSSEESPSFYVFTPSGGKGFVIVAGDDVFVPVLGYSFENQIPHVDQLPHNIRFWLEKVHESIVYVRQQEKASSSSVGQKWVSSRAGEPMIMLETPTWGQRNPYNQQCPLDGTENSIVGCTAVAIATIMRYHEWPKAGKGMTEAYVTSSKNIHVNARNLEHEYDWNKMKMEYVSNSYNNEEANAVATLMADVAIAIQADFSSKSTAASAKPDKLYQHFDYHPGMYWVNRENYDVNEWKQLMMDELMRERPVLYRGDDNANLGHAFVLDGCTTDDYFHVNWGWSGYCDGFFYLNALTPSDNNYNYNQAALLNMIPNDGSEIDYWLIAYQTGIVANTTDFHPYSSFQITACVDNNNDIMEFSGSFRLAVTDSEGTIKEWICDEETDMNLPPHSYYPSLYFSCMITGDISIGDRIRMFYREKDKEEWKLITSLSSNIPWEILIADEYTISESTSVSFDKESGILIVSFKDDVAATILYNGQPVANGITYNLNSLEVETKELVEGIYTIKLEKGLDIKEFTFEVKPL